MKAYLINLDRSTERLAAAEAQLRTAQIVYERVSAVDGRALTFRERRRACSYGRFLLINSCLPLPGIIGCALSHLEVYRRMIAEQIPYALILEDDVKLEQEAVPSALRQIVDVVNPDEPAAWLLHNHHKFSLPDGRAEGILPVRKVFFAEAYVITLAGAQLLLRVNTPILTLADAWERWRQYGLHVFMVFPTAACQSGTTSDIAEFIAPRRMSWRWYVALWNVRTAVFHALDRFLFYLTGR
ncbi:MAG: glycosyltransferase family 25 protein [Kiritimatiellia bacterium]